MRVILLVLLFPSLASAASEEVARKVRLGIAHFEAGRYDAAATVFAEAGEANPADPRIAYNRACAYAARGDVARAVEMFQQAALARDRGLSARSHYNLGNLAAEKAREEFGPKPEDAPPPVRQEGLKRLARAIGHYRDCLRIEPDHAAARHNLELIRIWINRMERIWEEKDRKQDRDEETLLEMLAKLEKRQRELRLESKQLAAEPDSPQRRESASRMAESQQALAARMETLREKITETLAGPVPSDEAQRAEQVLRELVDRAAGHMAGAADVLNHGEPAKAVESQARAVETLDELFMAVVPFVGLVQKAIESEKELVGRVEAAGRSDAEEAPDLSEAAWDQRFVARWSEILPRKAEAELAQLKAAASGPAADRGGSPGNPELAKMKQQAAAMAKAMEKAVEVGPKIAKLTEEAADHLESEEAADALPKQKEALKLLEEILQSLPKQDNRQDRKQQQDQQAEGEQMDENQGRQQGPDENDKPQEDDGQQKTPQQQQPEEQQRPSDAPQQKDVSQEEAEAMIRQVRNRQQQRREMEKRLQRYLARPVPVEKDW